MKLREFISAARCVLNLINTMAGASFLAMAFNITLIGQVGFGLSLLMVAILNFITQDFIATVWLEKRNSMKEGSDMPDYLKECGSKPLSQLYNVVIILSMFGTLCFYVIVSRTCLEQVVYLVTGDNQRIFIYVFSVCFGIVAFLLSLVKGIGNQAIFSLFSFLILISLLIVVMAEGAKNQIPSPYIQPPFSFSALSVIGTNVFAFTHQMNTIPIYNDLLSPSRRKIRIVNFLGIGSVFIIFGLFGYFGFLSQGDNSNPNLLLGFDARPAVLIFMIFKALFTYPIIARPLIVSLQKIAPRIKKTRYLVQWAICDALIVIGSVVIGCFIHDISLVTSFIGSITDVSISFLFPSLLLINHLNSKDDKKRYSVGAEILTNMSLILTGLTLFGFLENIQ